MKSEETRIEDLGSKEGLEEESELSSQRNRD
jgi:hypothetical protein